MVEKIVQHKHCPVCGKAMPPNRDVCSNECKVIFEKNLKTKRMWVMLFYVAMGIFILSILITNM